MAVGRTPGVLVKIGDSFKAGVSNSEAFVVSCLWCVVACMLYVVSCMLPAEL
jgi:hypothetical protein